LRFKLSDHAKQEMKRRGISPALLDSVLQHPQQVIDEERGKKVYQSQLDVGAGRIFLLRAIINDEVDPAIVVTVYRTSKIIKYWRAQ
jgi:hypothetical protein